MIPIAYSTFDYVGLVAAVVGTVLTGVATVTAFFGPAWAKRRRRPLVTISSDAETELITDETQPELGGVTSAVVIIENARGRATAHDVEILMSVDIINIQDDFDGTPATRTLTSFFEDANLNYEPLNQDLGACKGTVPAGSKRPVHIANLGDPVDIYRRIGRGNGKPLGDITDLWGAWAIYPSRQDSIRWIRADQAYGVYLTVQGRNFTAKHYRGELALEVDPVQDIPSSGFASPISIMLRWKLPLTETASPRVQASVVV